ncbi:L-fuculokinase [Alteribacillus sp. HJP-4]|uniref:FGGY-family carbohydrate kinase n=1 Tax=Alteribacillus sp. HJP-4 TaxID=2775394 RepID=UPI0035CD208B
MAVVSIDIGTTHCKAAKYLTDGKEIAVAVVRNDTRYDERGNQFYDAEQLFDRVLCAVKSVVEQQPENIDAVGITSMAETGLLIDRKTGEIKSHMIPWFDTRAESFVDRVKQTIDVYAHFVKTGLHPSYKYGLMKLLYLQETSPQLLENAVWLSAADYICWKLTGEFVTDHSLAARTYVYRVDTKQWDTDAMKLFGLSEELFPMVYDSGTKAGEVHKEASVQSGLSEGVPVAVCGHDHVCATVGANANTYRKVLDSIGTAESLVGTIPRFALGKSEYESGFHFGPHVLSGTFFWMGGVPASGGSVEWFRTQWTEEKAISYETLNEWLNEVPAEPTGIIYVPHLSGRGAPFPSANASAAFIGLKKKHKKQDIWKALLEGTAYELAVMKQAAEHLLNTTIIEMQSVGGGTKNAGWMQIKADVTGCFLSIPETKEAALFGAALTAGIGNGIYAGAEEISYLPVHKNQRVIEPEPKNHHRYTELLQRRYIPAAEIIRSIEQTGRET